ncbi:hypothetical protein D3C85_173140 [compost metagenome]
MGRQQVRHHGHAAVAAAAGVLVVGQDLDILERGQGFLAAVDAVDHGRDRRAVQDHDIALAADLLCQVGARHVASHGVVGHHGGRRAHGAHVDGDHDHARIARFLDGRGDTLGIDGVQDDDVGLVGNKVFNLVHLGVQVILAGHRGDFHARAAQFFRAFFRAAANRHEERVGQVAHAHADGFQRFVSGESAAGGGQQQGGGNDFFHEDLQGFLLSKTNGATGETY